MIRKPRPLDLALGAGFAAFALTEEYVVRMPGRWWPYALTLCAALVVIRRAVPLLAMAVNSVAACSLFYDDTPVSYRLWQLVAMMISAYTVGQLFPAPQAGRRDRLRGAAGAGLVLLTALLYWENDRTDPMAAVFFTTAPYALGAVVAAQARRLADTAAVRASIREQQAREAVMEERVRIARELHDMVAHSVTVMVIQAGALRRRLDAGLGVDPQVLHGIEEAGREAVGELRRTLGLLRGDRAETAPPAGLDRLDDLAGQVREAGLKVTVDRTGAPAPLPPAVDLSAYRIIQEALTNALKHAGATTATVMIAPEAGGVRLTVSNDGPVVPPPTAGNGQGLIGMRERVALFGGTLAAGPREGGGFAVQAWLPALPGTASTSAGTLSPGVTG
ncbi:sensor histidine kinase [Actinoplanes sp. NPDC049316]|uniref:sensor histidine kinase n=1 Tax=Actinoplanes sp. NPDC049316 TaxID=3154727 RepID=UPI003414A0C7